MSLTQVRRKVEENKLEATFVLACVLGSAFVLLYNLGISPLMADEGLRSTVAIEMILSDNYVVPTIAGEFYYRKPPFYNWIIASFFLTFDSFSEFVFRLPAVLSLVFFGFFIWLISRKPLGDRVALLAGLSSMLYGRMLFYASVLGHIDVTFSLFTFVGFYCVYYYSKKEKWLALFILSYFLAACGTLMKGLPSILFQGFTLFSWLIYKKEWKQLLSIQHLTGLLIYIVIVAGYFYTYSTYNSLESYFFELYDQSSQRTVIDTGWLKGLVNLFTFPFENIWHLFPFSLLFVFIIKKGYLKMALKNEFLVFVGLTFLVNIPPYWLSPGFYPRYLFMLYPLLLIYGAHAYYQNRKFLKWASITFFTVMLLLATFVVGAVIYSFFMVDISFLPDINLKLLLIISLTLLVLLLFYRFPKHRIYSSLLILIVFRFGFDLLVLPYRLHEENNWDQKERVYAEQILELTKGHDVYVHKDSQFNVEYQFYLSREKGKIVPRYYGDLRKGDYYVTIVPYVTEEMEIVFHFSTKWNHLPLVLVRKA